MNWGMEYSMNDDGDFMVNCMYAKLYSNQFKSRADTKQGQTTE